MDSGFRRNDIFQQSIQRTSQKGPCTRQRGGGHRSIPMMVCEDFLEEANEVDGLFHQPTKKGRHPPKNAALDKERKGALSSS